MSKSVAKRKATIDSLDLECIKYKLVTEQGWSLEKSDYVEKHYKAFLFACAAEADIVPIPSREIDEFWHTHILDTRKYHDDCKKVAGKYIHHYPYIGLHSEDDPLLIKSYEQTRSLMMDIFNIDPAISWEESCAGS